jgi:hypothetical protein
MSKNEGKRIGGSILRLEFGGISFCRENKTCETVETYIAVTLSKTVNRTCHFSIRRSHSSINASLKMKGNESEEVYFVQDFVASVLVVKHPHDVEDLIQTL